MKRKIALTAVIALFSTAALAGIYQPAPLTVDLDARIAFGDMLSTANSEDDVSYIGCGVRSIDSPLGFSFRFGFCQASDAEENSVICFTQSEQLIDDMRASSDFSFVQFSWEDDPGTGLGEFVCTRVGFSTQSFYLTEVEEADVDEDDDD